MASIESRLTALAEIVRRRQFADEGPVDSLSASLFAFEDELLSLDELEKAALLYELNCGDPLEGTMGLDLTLFDLERMIGEMI